MGVHPMNVKARLSRQDGGSHRHWRASRGIHPPRHRDVGSGPAVRAETPRIQEGELPQDQAVYTCQCGFVFEALVSTSVNCPHCGSTQAW